MDYPIGNQIRDFVDMWGSAFQLLFMVALVFLMWKAMKSMPISRFKKNVIRAEDVNVSWDDVAGADEAKREVKEIIDVLIDGKKFAAMGAKVPKGALLYGPPGTGKTLIAKAAASEAGAAFIACSGSEFVQMFVGLGAKRVRSVFSESRKIAKGRRKLFGLLGTTEGRPVIIFIDEIDAMGGKRGNDHSGEKDQTLNQLLVEMDGFDSSNIIVLAASNRIDTLDPALIRPGRLDRQILVTTPDVKGRRDILDVHLANKPVAKDINLEKVAQRTAGLSGAELANIANEAALYAVRCGDKEIGQKHFEYAQERIVAGVETKRVLSEDEKATVAFHEAGHALSSELLPNLDRVHKISIIPRGAALGFSLNLPDKDRVLRSRTELEDMMVMLLAGRAAEQVEFGCITTGASNDLERVAAIARAMVTEYGFGENLGVQAVGVGDYSTSEETRRRVDAESQRFSQTAWDRALSMMTEHRQTLAELANHLRLNETLDRHEIVAIAAPAREKAGLKESSEAGFVLADGVGSPLAAE